jgi:hypothetical protein
MSAKLLKALARGHCEVRNSSNTEVVVYWKDDERKMRHRIIRSGEQIDLLNEASVKQLRASVNLKNLFNRRLLTIVSPSS